MKILLTGGGTGGHLIPLLGVVSELKKINNDCNKAPQPCETMEPANLEFLLITPASDFNQNISEAEIQVKIIKAGKLRRYFSWENFKDILKIPVGIFQSLYYIYKFKPDIVFSKGGFASIPPVIAAWILKVPIVTHESDIVPGLANRIIAHFASKILVSFSATEKYFNKNKVVLTGNPIRHDIADGNCENALKFFKLSPDLPTILIFGGSQGAQKINEVILKILSRALERVQIIHVCGKNNYSELKNRTEKLNIKNKHRYKIYPFLSDELKDAYTLADIVISRAGANSLSEIIALEKPSIIIPLSTSANDHQLQNAEYYSQRGMAILIKEQDFNEEVLKNELLKLLQENDFKDNIKRKMAEYNKNKKNSASLIAKEIFNLNNK